MTELELRLVFEKSLFLWKNSRIYFAVFFFKWRKFGQNLAAFFSKDYLVTGGGNGNPGWTASFWGFDRCYALTQSLTPPTYQYWPTARKDNYSTRWIFLVFILVCKRNIDITYQFRVFLLQIPIICCYKLHGPKVICFLCPGTSSKTSLQERRYTNTLYIYLKTIVNNWFSVW